MAVLALPGRFAAVVRPVVIAPPAPDARPSSRLLLHGHPGRYSKDRKLVTLE